MEDDKKKGDRSLEEGSGRREKRKRDNQEPIFVFVRKERESNNFSCLINNLHLIITGKNDNNLEGCVMAFHL